MNKKLNNFPVLYLHLNSILSKLLIVCPLVFKFVLGKFFFVYIWKSSYLLEFKHKIYLILLFRYENIIKSSSDIESSLYFTLKSLTKLEE